MKPASAKCPECGSVLSRGQAGVDEVSPVGDAVPHDDQEASRTAAAAPGHGEDAGGALEAAASFLVGSAGTGGSLGTLAATAEQERQIREWAEKTGRLISEEGWRQHRLICSSTAEHEVRFRAEDDRAIKKTHAGTYGFIPRLEGTTWRQSPATPLEYLTRCLLQNRFFNDDIRLEGVLISSGPSLIIGQSSGGISLIISQPWIKAANRQEPHPSEADIAERMRSLGFDPIPQSFFGWRHTATEMVLLDAKRDNFIRNQDGIAPIDLQMTCPSGTPLPMPQASAPPAGARVTWRCPNPDCPAQVRARLKRWCALEVMDIAGVGEDLVGQLVQRGLVLNVAELYELTEDELLQLEGMDEKSAGSLLTAIEASKSRELWRVIIGLEIPQVDAVTARALAQHFPRLEELMAARFDKLKRIEGVSDLIARSLLQWSKDSHNRRLAKRLRAAGLKSCS